MSLKLNYADEIADAMAKLLGDSEYNEIFRTASLQKTAGPALEAFKKDVDAAVVEGTDLELIYSKHVNTLAQEENVEPGTVGAAREYMAEKAKGVQPGMTVPKADDTCAECLDPNTLAALNFTIKHLVKIADALDGKGFVELAAVVDEAAEKVASKKKITKTAVYESELWNALPDIMKEQVIPNWKELPPTHLEYQLTNPQTMQKIQDRLDQYRAQGQQGQQERTEEVEKMKSLTPAQPSEKVQTVKQVQKMLGVKDDGIWGPITAGAWNKYVKTLEQPWPLLGVDPSGSYSPAVETLKSVLMGAGKKKDQTAGQIAPAPDLSKLVPGPGEVKTGPMPTERIPNK